jgi:methylmalonyl-CoA/ethylmalonyl-CoA epimerase
MDRTITRGNMKHKGLDHLAIAVANTDEALKSWRDLLGFEVLYAQKVNNDSVLLTHLDLGNTQLQLVEPLIADSPLAKAVAEKGSHLHHFCLLVDDVAETKLELNAANIGTADNLHQGTNGKRALFINKEQTDSIQVELTGK